MKIRRIHLEKTDSTNSFLRNIPVGEEDMTVVTADFQTAGRGQGTNTWESEPGANLLMSVAVKPLSVPVRRQFLLSMAGALAVGDALSSYTDGISLKWPNDIYWNDKKMSGTLIETSVAQGCLQRCIFGIGVNVNQTVFLSDAPYPVSLRNVTKKEIPVSEVADRVVECLDKRLSQLLSGDSETIVRTYHERLYRREGFHAYRDAEGVFSAAISQVAEDGHLLLCDTGGRLRSYAFKEVTFLL
jgi:BirA family biotin operon repressor/biotin-[acetyl-CoA-carboxylase] ligase